MATHLAMWRCKHWSTLAKILAKVEVERLGDTLRNVKQEGIG